MTEPRRGRFRFSIGTLMLLTFVFGVVGAAGRQFVRAVHQGTSPRAVFVIFTLAAPMIVLVILSLIHQVSQWSVRQSRRSSRESPTRLDS